jgi:hypothetical protein
MKLESGRRQSSSATNIRSCWTDTVLDFVELNPGEFNFIFIDGRQVPVHTNKSFRWLQRRRL